jgi:hypothetical protein
MFMVEPAHFICLCWITHVAFPMRACEDEVSRTHTHAHTHTLTCTHTHTHIRIDTHVCIYINTHLHIGDQMDVYRAARSLYDLCWNVGGHGPGCDRYVLLMCC